MSGIRVASHRDGEGLQSRRVLSLVSDPVQGRVRGFPWGSQWPWGFEFEFGTGPSGSDRFRLYNTVTTIGPNNLRFATSLPPMLTRPAGPVGLGQRYSLVDVPDADEGTWGLSVDVDWAYPLTEFPPDGMGLFKSQLTIHDNNIDWAKTLTSEPGEMLARIPVAWFNGRQLLIDAIHCTYMPVLSSFNYEEPE